MEQSRKRSSTLPYTFVWQLSKRESSVHPRLRSPTLLFYFYKHCILTNTYCIFTNIYCIFTNIYFYFTTWSELWSPSKISWSIWLLYCDQLCLHLSYNKCFASFHMVIPLFKLVKYKFLITLHGVKLCSTCQCTNYHNTINHSKYH